MDTTLGAVCPRRVSPGFMGPRCPQGNFSVKTPQPREASVDRDHDLEPRTLTLSDRPGEAGPSRPLDPAGGHRTGRGRQPDEETLNVRARLCVCVCVGPWKRPLGSAGARSGTISLEV